MEKRALVVLHLLATGVVFLSEYYWLVILVVSSLLYSLHRWRLRSVDRVVGLQDDFVWIEYPAKTRQHYKLGRRHFISDYLVIMELKPDSTPYSVGCYFVIFSDAVNGELLRRLRVRLCLSRRAKPANSLASE